MIGKITGVFSGYYNNIAIIDVTSNEGCVGYEILMKNSEVLSLNKGALITLYIKQIIKEDDNVLYGFLSFADKCLFEELIKLSGLGPKIALGILSTYSYENIIEAIMTDNRDFFSSVSGIGSKLANRIPNEMIKNVEKINERIMNFGIVPDNKLQQISSKVDTEKPKKNKKLCENDNNKKNTSTNDNKHVVNDAVDALIALGFSKQQIYNDVFKIVKENNSLATEDVIKKFLQSNEK